MVAELVEQFIPAADEVSRLQRGEDAEAVFFQSFCEDGHYKGRTTPSRTRQGIYAIAPRGALLGACTTRDPRVMARMIRGALVAWRERPPAQRKLEPPRREALAAVTRWRDKFPVDGLVLEVTTRDLKRDGPIERAHRHDWNRDFAWFRADEARAFVPAAPRVGDRHQVPRPLIERLVRYHLVDNVRGQTSAHREKSVERAELVATVRAVDGDVISLALTGATRASNRGRWSVRGFDDQNDPSQQQLGFETELLGDATFDLAAGRFTAFEVVATGTRWGGTKFNARGDDLSASPIGVVLRLAAEDAPRVAPAHIWRYGW